MDTLFETVIANWQTKLNDIRNRMISTICQLNDEQINWRPNEESNSIANLIVHIEGNIHQRIESSLLGGEDRRDRDAEFDNGVYLGKDELIRRFNSSLDFLLNAVSGLTEERLLQPMQVRNKTVFVYDVVNGCTTHFSEHLGQVLYLAKLQLADKYVTASIPKKKS